jgi:streptogramin lyase
MVSGAEPSVGRRLLVLCAAALIGLQLPAPRVTAHAFSATAHNVAPASPAACPLPIGQPAAEHLIARIRVGGGNHLSRPIDILSGLGSIWVLNHSTGSLIRINPRTNRVMERISLPGSSQAGQYHTYPAVGSGAVWLGGPWLTRVDVRRGTASSVSRMSGGTAIGFGYLWLADGSHKILWRLDLRTGKVLSKIRLEREGNEGLTTVRVGDGSLWVEDADTRLIVRIDPRSGHVIKRMHLGYAPVDIVFSGNSVWVVDTGKPNDYYSKAGCSTFYDIDPNTYAVKDKVSLGPNGGVPASAAAGRLWIRPAASLLVALNASNGRPEEALEGFPSDVEIGQALFANGSVWVTNVEDGSVWRLRP